MLSSWGRPRPTPSLTGKTSHDYRKERFTLLLSAFNIRVTPTAMSKYLELYERTLMDVLELKSGVLSLFSLLQELGKKIVVITEGPQDAQERTIQALGIADQIDYLATTNHFGVAKTTGLFSKVLAELSIAPGDVAYVGDSEKRDVIPAMAEGIFTIHLDEARHISLSADPPRINALEKLGARSPRQGFNRVGHTDLEPLFRSLTRPTEVT